MNKDAATPDKPEGSRLKNFTRHERESGLHPAIRALHSRPVSRDPAQNTRAVHYTRIQRGWQV